jgi:large conductance mechanosensitive channel
MGLMKEFKEFALRGNVLDLAVGVIIGAEFGKIVNSMISDLIMPVIAKLMGGGVDFSNKFLALGADVTATNLVDARKQGAVLAWGNFVTVTINFVILAFCIFLVVKAFNTAKKRFETQQAAPPPAGPTKDQQLLMEIRDALKGPGRA